MKHFWNTTSLATIILPPNFLPDPDAFSSPFLPNSIFKLRKYRMLHCFGQFRSRPRANTQSHKVPCAAATGRVRKIRVTLKVPFVLRCHYSINRACFIISHHIQQFPISYYQQQRILNERERMPANHLRNLLTHPHKGRKVRASLKMDGWVAYVRVVAPRRKGILNEF